MKPNHLLQYLPAVLEKKLSQHRVTQSMYSRLFYRKMIASEIRYSRLQPDARVLHIGAGAAPFTAVGLARAGFRVTAIDCCRNAVCMACDYITSASLRMKTDWVSRLECRHACGETLDIRNYEAVWISLHVPQAPAIIQNIRAACPDTVIVWRCPSKWVRWAYPRKSFPRAHELRHFWGNRSYILKPHEEASLTELKKGDTAVFCSIPDHSDLPSLSIRPGKNLTYMGRAAFNGPCIVCTGSRRVAICPGLAGNIRVRRHTS